MSASLPVGLFGTFLFLQVLGLANDVYAQIGLVMLVGLLGKNAILIVEFAVHRRQEGLSRGAGCRLVDRRQAIRHWETHYRRVQGLRRLLRCRRTIPRDRAEGIVLRRG